jgi:twinkle protein
MKSASQILSENHIVVRSFRYGNIKTKCPRCSHLRRHKADPCLSVSIKPDGVVFFCHNCSFQGGEYFESRVERPVWSAKPHHSSRPRGGGYSGLHHAAASAWR